MLVYNDRNLYVLKISFSDSLVSEAERNSWPTNGQQNSKRKNLFESSVSNGGRYILHSTYRWQPFSTANILRQRHSRRLLKKICCRRKLAEQPSQCHTSNEIHINASDTWSVEKINKGLILCLADEGSWKSSAYLNFKNVFIHLIWSLTRTSVRDIRLTVTVLTYCWAFITPYIRFLLQERIIRLVRWKSFVSWAFRVPEIYRHSATGALYVSIFWYNQQIIICFLVVLIFLVDA